VSWPGVAAQRAGGRARVHRHEAIVALPGRLSTRDEFRTGLDHFAFGVATRAELEDWQRELSSRGITFTPITETPIGSVIVFRDPDNIQLEFWLPADRSKRS
jgi:catechol 2,3-dioxygenase-like lactoylglutathione lyase family enzyme